MPPGRLSMCLPAHSVLELPAGTIAQTRTQHGDLLKAVVLERAGTDHVEKIRD
jgi:uncharacterized membrane protein (UPF0127 family)